MIFFLGYCEIDKKQKFSALDTIESQSKKMRSLSYLTLMIDIFLFLVVPTLKLRICIITLPADRQEIILSLPVQQKVKLPSSREEYLFLLYIFASLQSKIGFILCLLIRSQNMLKCSCFDLTFCFIL